MKWSAGIGAIAAAAGVIGHAASCRNERGDGPGCGLVVVFAPAAAAFGGSVGALIGSWLPVNPWRRVVLAR
jgi:hypothetical protein